MNLFTLMLTMLPMITTSSLAPAPLAQVPVAQVQTAVRCSNEENIKDKLGESWRKVPMSYFSIQCSHNSYVAGRQSQFELQATDRIAQLVNAPLNASMKFGMKFGVYTAGRLNNFRHRIFNQHQNEADEADEIEKMTNEENEALEYIDDMFEHRKQYAASVHAWSVTNALKLGYRCVELDVHPSYSKEHKDVLAEAAGTAVGESSNAAFGVVGNEANEGTCPSEPELQVCHRAGSLKMTNDIQLEDQLDELKKWLREDDKKKGCKTPIIISLELHMTDTEEDKRRENNKLMCLFERTLGKRLIHYGQSMMMNDLVSERRKVIIKGKRKPLTGDSGVIIALPKTKDNGDQLEMHSFEAASSNKKLRESVANNPKQMVRIYPSKFNFSSENYDVKPYFEACTQAVCFNYQGMMDNGIVCRSPIRGVNGQGGCNNREGIAKVEKAFMIHGFDGYVPFPRSNTQVGGAASVKSWKNFLNSLPSHEEMGANKISDLTHLSGGPLCRQALKEEEEEEEAQDAIQNVLKSKN